MQALHFAFCLWILKTSKPKLSELHYFAMHFDLMGRHHFDAFIDRLHGTPCTISLTVAYLSHHPHHLHECLEPFVDCILRHERNLAQGLSPSKNSHLECSSPSVLLE